MAMLLAAVASGCGAGRKRDLPETPEWTTQDGNVETRIGITETLINSGAIGEALVVIAQMRADGIRDPRVDYLQGRGLLAQGVNSEAERLLLISAEAMRGDPRPWRSLGILYADDKRQEEAIDALTKAADYDPDHAATWNNLGFLLMSDKRHGEAAKALQNAVALDATVPRYRNNLGFALAATGRYDDALKAFRSTGSNADAHANLATAYERAGDPELARVHYTKALSFSPTHQAAAEGIERLDNLPTEPQ